MITVENIAIYFACINFLAFFIFWQDKRASQKGGWRVSEFVLLVISLFGGTVGAYFAMKIFRHKTKKGSFRWRFWTIVILQVLFLWGLFFLALSFGSDS